MGTFVFYAYDVIFKLPDVVAQLVRITGEVEPTVFAVSVYHFPDLLSSHRRKVVDPVVVRLQVWLSHLTSQEEM